MKSPENRTIISVSTGTFVRALLILAGFWVLWTLHDLVLVIITAVVLASSIEPAVKWLGKYRIHRIPAVLSVYIALASLIVGMFYAFVPPLVNELVQFSQQIPSVAKELSVKSLVGEGSVLKAGETLVEEVKSGASIRDIYTALNNFTDGSQGILGTAGAIFGGIFSFILIVVLSFYFAMQERGIENFLRIVIPSSKEEYAIDLWNRSREKIGKWMQGQLLLGVLIFVLVYLGLTIFGIPYALVLALLAGVMEIIPVFGPIIAAIPGVFIAFGAGGMTLALIIAGFYLLVQQFESNLIYPLVVRKVVGVPPILVILALIVGFELAGFLGILISVPVAAAIMEFVDDIEKKRVQKNGNV
ncbi:MAG: AI-2E family transporter [Patescibacteria group bacterium]